jgi:thioredoxin-like negative regulator of GroEL
MKKVVHKLSLALFILTILIFYTCASTRKAQKQANATADVAAQDASSSLQEARSALELGSPASLEKSIAIIEGNASLKSSEAGRMLEAVAAALLQKVYPAFKVTIPALNPPAINTYAQILQDAAKGTYRSPPSATQDYLALTLPFLAFMNNSPEPIAATAYQEALPNLEQARVLNPRSCLAPYFLGIAYEKTGRLDDAAEAYSYSWEQGSDQQKDSHCYPAGCALVLLLAKQGKTSQASSLFQTLSANYANNTVAATAARFYFDEGDWDAALKSLNSILSSSGSDPANAPLYLMQAQAGLETAHYSLCRDALNRYARLVATTANPNQAQNNPDYRFLQIRYLAESASDQDGRTKALSLIRGLVAAYPQDQLYKEYAAVLLLSSSDASDNAEGRRIYQSLSTSAGASSALPPSLLKAMLKDAVSRQSWTEAKNVLARIPARNRTGDILVYAAQTERALGDNQAALRDSGAAYRASPSDDEAILSYVTSLIDTGSYLEAGRLINNRLPNLSAGPIRSRYYYQRSRLQVRDDLRLADLQSSRYDDMRNMDTLIALINYYIQNGNTDRAELYLKQAQSVAPDSPRLIPYEK